MSKKIIIWLRQDLRLNDNEALYRACEENANILPIFILDDENAGENARFGGATRWFLHQALGSLNAAMSDKIQFFSGRADEILPALVQELGADAVYWNRCYEPWRTKRDEHIKHVLKNDLNIEVKSFQGSLLWEPWTALKGDGTPYRVFTPFYKKGCLSLDPPSAPLPKPDKINYDDAKSKHSINLKALDLLPKIGWDKKMEAHWDISEEGALKRFKTFLQNGVNGYKEDRNRPDMDNTSMLSPYLAHGIVSPRTLWHGAKNTNVKNPKDVEHFCSELGWREFSYMLLYHFQEHVTEKPFMEKFENFPWQKADPEIIERWQKGQTGYPIVDAGMRQLWQTGWMHNRVRMIVGSFLVKHLLIHWKEGERWFWDTLIDADLANNSASWQWVAGSGADGAPYFRIFNPILQSQKFDPNGDYIRKYVPELKDLPTEELHAPWETKPLIMQQAGIKLGVDYPKPIVDHGKARDKALEAYKNMKENV